MSIVLYFAVPPAVIKSASRAASLDGMGAAIKSAASAASLRTKNSWENIKESVENQHLVSFEKLSKGSQEARASIIILSLIFSMFFVTVLKNSSFWCPFL